MKPLPPVESLNRIHDLSNRFLASPASEENPLALFIDDLQWCDTASFDFLANVFANFTEHSFLFFLGAYRHNEVDASHPLANFIASLSEGNPLFVSESLSYLSGEDLLFLNEDRQWLWDLDRIRRSRMPTTVVALFSSKIQKLPVDLIELLEYCACMGNTFSPGEIAMILDLPLTRTFEMLKPALGQGLLMENKGQLQFIHDRVQEAALSAIPAPKPKLIHPRMGNHLLEAAQQATEDAGRWENLFTIVSHLNLGRDHEQDAAAAYTLSDLNYHAGNKALGSLATEAANEY